MRNTDDTTSIDRLASNGHIRTLPIKRISGNSNITTFGPGLTISSYSELIPLEYLLYYNGEYVLSGETGPGIISNSFRSSSVLIHNTWSTQDRIILEQAKAHHLGPDFLSQLLVQGYVPESLYRVITGSYLPFSAPVIIGEHAHLSRNNTAEMFKAFTTAENLGFTLRTFNGVLGNYSLAVKNEQTTTYHILAAILPENLYYQRLHILHTGTIDLKYAIILIDEDLPNENFPIRGLRTFYIGRLKEALENTAAQIFFVPKEAISRLCMTQPYQLPRKIGERIEAVKTLGEIFKTFFSNGTIDPSKVWKKPVPLGPLVPKVEPTDLVEARFAQLSAPVIAESLVHNPIVQQQLSGLNEIRERMLETASMLVDLNDTY